MLGKYLSAMLLVAVLLPVQTALPQEYALALKINTLGITAEGIRTINPYLNLRAGVALFKYATTGGGRSQDDYQYSADLNLQSASVVVDYFPLQRGFKLTAGVIYTKNKLRTRMVPVKTYQSGGDLYTPDMLGFLTADIRFAEFAPYAGIGFGNPLAGTGGFGFTFEAGAYYLGSPKVTLTGSGLIAPSASKSQQQQLAKNISWIKWYPVIALGITYTL